MLTLRGRVDGRITEEWEIADVMTLLGQIVVHETAADLDALNDLLDRRCASAGERDYLLSDLGS